MSEYVFSLEGSRRLTVAWGSFWKDIHVSLDGKRLGTFAHQRAFFEGETFTLSDGSSLRVRAVKDVNKVKVIATLDGVALPDGVLSPEHHIKSAGHILYFVGGLSLVLGILSIVAKSIFSVKSALDGPLRSRDCSM